MATTTEATFQERFINMMMNDISPSFSIDKGESINVGYVCTEGNDTSSLQVIKKESNDLSYKVSVLFNGIMNGRSSWCVLINGKPLMERKGLVSYEGSTKFVLTPLDGQTIEIQETDENRTEVSWLDLSEEFHLVYITPPSVSERIRALIESADFFQPAYLLYTAPPLVSGRIEALIESANFFQPPDDKKVDTILYSNYDGVFLRARDRIGNFDIFHAKAPGKFMKCPITSFLIEEEFREELQDIPCSTVAVASASLPVADFATREGDSSEASQVQQGLVAEIIEGVSSRAPTELSQNSHAQIGIVLSGEDQTHTLTLHESETRTSENYITKALWDNFPLKIITVKREN